MEKIGKIPEFKTYNEWHHVEFNIFDMLKGYTNTFIVKEIDLANWDSA